MSELTHINKEGDVHMVDVSDKEITERIAVAVSIVKFPPEAFETIKKNGFNTKKGSLTQTAVLAGIGAVKKTSDLIPLCHNIPISKVDIDIQPTENGFEISCMVKTTGQTGVEMEALTGASVAGLCIYDMCKALSHDIIIGPTQLQEKKGGKRDFKR
ncbi:cyclic pyranopterin monophosphate synthase MoaC [Ekhidna sp.]|uniref:cyclic pyranopterin monophosphate synthase MoaC n=1 Tax=Ekhidna sp. TaxID=2608089 RepID=UPI003CCB793D